MANRARFVNHTIQSQCALSTLEEKIEGRAEVLPGFSLFIYKETEKMLVGCLLALAVFVNEELRLKNGGD